MGYTPIFDTLESPEPLHDGQIAVARPKAVPLRFGGLSLDPVSGVVHFRGRTVALSPDERTLLATMLRRAGQITSRERIAAMSGTSVKTLDRRMQALRMTLKAAGVTCLPCPVNGLGYILWRC